MFTRATELFSNDNINMSWLKHEDCKYAYMTLSIDPNQTTLSESTVILNDSTPLLLDRESEMRAISFFLLVTDAPYFSSNKRC